MRFTVASNWDIELLDGLKEFSSVKQIFAKMPTDIIGGGRCHLVLPTIDREGVKQYVEETHKRGLKLVYVLNANCIGNIEYDKKGLQKIMDFMGWLSDIKVDGIALTSHVLIKTTRQRFPELKISASVFAHIGSVEMAKHYEDLGCDTITLPYFINRDFRLLENIRNSVKCDLQLFVQNACLHNCINAGEHGCFMAHASQPGSKGKLVAEYYAVNCANIKMLSPEEFIKSRWIRPEDLITYEDIGYTNFKITDRSRNTPWLLRTTKAYHERRYDGNLADILSIEFPDYRSEKYHRSIFKNVREMYIKNKDNVDESFRRWLRFADRGDGRPHINNNALDGFLNYFKKVDCRKISCDECNYCKKVADEVISFNENARQVFINEAEEFKEVFYNSFKNSDKE